LQFNTVDFVEHSPTYTFEILHEKRCKYLPKERLDSDVDPVAVVFTLNNDAPPKADGAGVVVV